MVDLTNIEDLIESGQLVEANEKLSSVIKTDPQNSEALYLKALLSFKRDQFADSVAIIQNAIKITDQDYRFYELLGQAMGLKAQMSGALKGAILLPKIKSAFLKAIDLNPKALKAKEGLFVLYLFTPSVAGGDEAKAIEIIEDIKEYNPGHASLLQAMLFGKNKNDKSAEESIDNALKLCPEDTEVIFKAARFYLAQNSLGKALSTIDSYIKLKPYNPLAYDVKADCFYKKNELTSAIECYKKALELNDAFFPARRKMAETMLEAGDKESAKSEFEYILKNHPKTPAEGIAKKALKGLS